jgi:hypothetical protein
MDENVMHRSLYEKVRKKVMNEQRKTQMNTCRDPCGYWFLEILPYRTMICCFSPTLFEIFEQHINIRTTYFITGMQAK